MPAADPITRIKVNGVEITAPRTRGDVAPKRLVLRNLDGPDTFEFSEFGALTPSYPFWSRVTVEVAFDSDGDGTIAEADYKLRFAGVVNAAPRAVPGGLRIDYQCVGLKFLANEVRVRHPQSGKSEVAFNLPPTDPLYEEELARLPVGEIVRRVLTYDGHATDLWYQGVTAYTADPPLIDPLRPELGRAYNTPAGSPPVLKTDTLNDLAGMSVVPFGEVRLSGAKLWQQVENLVEDVQPYRGVEILPDGTIRFHDTRSPTWAELRLSDSATPLELPSLSYDATQCYGAVEIVGSDEVGGRTFQTNPGGGVAASLAADWLAADQTAWKITDHTIKTDSTSSGTIPANGIGPRVVTVRPTGGALSWSAGRWAVDRAEIELVLPIGPNNPSELSERIRVAGNTACAAGGTSAIELEASPRATGYTHFRLFGQSTNPRRWVWRRYRFVDPAIASRIVDVFPYDVFWQLRGGGQYVRVAQCKSYRRDTPASNPREADHSIDLFRDADGIIKVLLRNPVVEAWSTPAELEAGGASVKAPDNVLVFVPVSRGVLSVRRPASGWSGAASTNPHLRRTKYVTMTDWLFAGDTSRMADYADTILETMKEPVQSGDLNYLGLWRQGVETPNAAVKLTSSLGATPWDTEKLLVRSIEVAWPESGPVNHVTRVNISNQRRPWTGDRQYQPAMFADGGPLEGATLNA